MNRLTYFTPAYNAERVLPKLFETLCAQSVKEFEWLVVDDGSNDHTYEMVQEFMRKADFPVTLFRQENGGKHRAYNKAIKECRTELLCCVDADFIL